MNIKTYITYFDDRQVSEYNLKADENTVLFKGNDTSYSGESINSLNIFFCELCTMYYVWKNNLKSDYVCFKQYRRPFDWQMAGKMPKKGEVICYDSVSFGIPLITQFGMYHGKKRATELMTVIGKMYGVRSAEFKYFINSECMFTNNSFVMKWDDFVKMCEFVFDILDEIDMFYGLDYEYCKYEVNALEHTEDGRVEYQKHWPAYIGERLVSCYIATRMKPITISRLEGNGFFTPYKSKQGAV